MVLAAHPGENLKGRAGAGTQKGPVPAGASQEKWPGGPLRGLGGRRRRRWRRSVAHWCPPCGPFPRFRLCPHSVLTASLQRGAWSLLSQRPGFAHSHVWGVLRGPAVWCVPALSPCGFHVGRGGSVPTLPRAVTAQPAVTIHCIPFLHRDVAHL